MYYVDTQDRLTAVAVRAAGPTLRVGTPAPVLPPNYAENATGSTYGRAYNVATGGRFLMIKNEGHNDDQTAGSSLVVIHNWSEELRRVIPVH